MRSIAVVDDGHGMRHRGRQDVIRKRHHARVVIEMPVAEIIGFSCRSMIASRRGSSAVTCVRDDLRIGRLLQSASGEQLHRPVGAVREAHRPHLVNRS